MISINLETPAHVSKKPRGGDDSPRKDRHRICSRENIAHLGD